MNRRRYLMASLGGIGAALTGSSVFARQAAATVPTDPLDARLGGTQESFEAKYGKALPSKPKDIGPQYAIRGYSAVLLDVYQGRIDNISLFAPRPKGEEWGGDKVNPMNWSVAKSFDLASRFLPTDVQLSEPDIATNYGVIIRTGSSATLAREVPPAVYAYFDPTYQSGQCSYTLYLDPSKNHVSWIFIDLRNAEKE